jgi:hypothetical protein
MHRARGDEDDGALSHPAPLLPKNVFGRAFVDDNDLVVRMGMERDPISRRAAFEEQADRIDRLALRATRVRENRNLGPWPVVVRVV